MAGNHPHWSDPPDGVRVITHRYHDERERLVEETVRYHIYSSGPDTIVSYKTPGFLKRELFPDSEPIVEIPAQPLPSVGVAG